MLHFSSLIVSAFILEGHGQSRRHLGKDKFMEVLSWLDMLISWKGDITPSHMDALILLDVDCIFMFFVLLPPPSTLSSLLESLQVPVKQAVRCKSQGSSIFLMAAVCLCNTRLLFVLVTDKIMEEKKHSSGEREKKGESWRG